ncbi:MAG TPA: RcpC/CpaB family pilus assembly protein [Chloroflexota bacterium]|nr:RcpC/CpaB family pilus assembly protein [Chloroflexota bacterium]
MFNKLDRNSRSLLIVGVLLAVIAFALAFSVLSKASSSSASQATVQPTPGPVGQVLLAKTQVPTLTQITDAQAAVKQYFREEPVQQYLKANNGSIPPDYVQGKPGLEALLAQGARHLATGLSNGDPLLTSELITNTAPGTVDYSPLLTKGEVAETIAVQPVAAGNGNIQVSDHVDMLVTYKLPLQGAAPRLPGIDRSASPANTWETQTTLQNLRVLNVAGTNYTLAVHHQDALTLKWVKDTNGTVDLVVRAADDSGSYRTTAILPTYLADAGRMRSPFTQP